MMKIGIFIDGSKLSGGSFHHSSNVKKILGSIEDYNIKFYETNKLNKKRNGHNHEIYSINFLDRIFFLFYSSLFFKKILNKFKIVNRFERFIKKNKIDLVFFLGQSQLSIFCDNINFVSYIYEFHHKFRPDLPEYKGLINFDERERQIFSNTNKSIEVVVDTAKKSEELEKYYNCPKQKINVIPLLVNPNKFETKKINENILKFVKDQKVYFFYPAQYWAHKNHIFILETLKQIKENFKININFVFTGAKKENYKFIQNKLNSYNLFKNVKVFEYLDTHDLNYLFKNCSAVVMPTLIGYSCMPLFEAFYLKIPVIYTKDLLDNEYKKFVSEVDISNTKELSDLLINFSKRKEEFKKITNSAKEYFDKNLNDESIKIKYQELFKKISNKIKIYEQ